MTTERLTFGRETRIRLPRAEPAEVIRLPREAAPAVAAREAERSDWAWKGMLVFTVLVFFRPQDQFPGLASLHLMDIAALGGLAAMVFGNLSRRRPITRITPELVGVFALAAVIAATIPFSYWKGGAFEQFRTVFVPVALIFLLMTNTLNSPRRIDRICWVIVLAFGYMCTWTIVNFVRGTNLYDGRVTGPVGGFFANPNDLALNMASFLPLALIQVRRANPVFRRLLCAGIALLMLVVMFLTKSRGGTLGSLAMLIAFLLTARVLTPATIIALVVTTMATMPLLPQSFWNRMASITDPRKDDTGSRAERKMLLQQGWTVFMDHPLTGVGMGQFRNFYRPGLATRWHETHNVVLQVGAEIGVFGLAVFMFLVVRGFAAAWWTRRHLMWIYRKRVRVRGRSAAAADPRDGLADDERQYLQTHGTAMLACMVGWFVCALFASVAFNWTFYYVLGLAVAGRDILRTRERALRTTRTARRRAPAA